MLKPFQILLKPAAFLRYGNYFELTIRKHLPGLIQTDGEHFGCNNSACLICIISFYHLPNGSPVTKRINNWMKFIHAVKKAYRLWQVKPLADRLAKNLKGVNASLPNPEPEICSGFRLASQTPHLLAETYPYPQK